MYFSMYQTNEEERLAVFQFQVQKVFLHWISRIKNKNKKITHTGNNLENKMINSSLPSKQKAFWFSQRNYRSIAYHHVETSYRDIQL